MTPSWAKAALAAALVVGVVTAPGPRGADARADDDDGELTLLFAGDVNFAGRRRPPTPEAVAGPANPLRHFAARFRQADLALVNVEGLLAERVEATYGDDRLNISAPAVWARALSAAGLEVVSAANNHALDQGAEGRLETRRHLTEAGLTVLGLGATAEEATAPWVVERDGACVAVVPATLLSNRPRRPGAALAYYRGDAELPRLLRQVADLDERGCFVVVFIHWGREAHGHKASRRVIATGHALVGAGAHLIVGHHPHVLQGVELRRGGAAIAYSLGNFVFTNRDRDKRRTGLLRARLARDKSGALYLAELSLLPVMIDPRTLTPRPATTAQARDIAARMADYSAPFGTRVALVDGRVVFSAPPRNPGR